jgi:hypothetical protein
MKNGKQESLLRIAMTSKKLKTNFYLVHLISIAILSSHYLVRKFLKIHTGNEFFSLNIFSLSKDQRY